MSVFASNSKIKTYTFSYMIDYQGEKFQKKLADLGLSATEAAKRIGISRDTIHKWFKKDRLDYKQVSKITDGLGLSEDEVWGVAIPKPKQEITPLPTDAYMMVEYVDLSASAGALGLTDIEMLPETKLRLVPREFDRGNYLVVRVNGDSMVDGTDVSIPDGAEILVKEYTLEPGEKLPIRGNLFVICSSEGNVFKQITEHNLEEGFIRCHSYNPKYPDYTIPLSEIFQIFIYRKIVALRPSIPEIK